MKNEIDCGLIVPVVPNFRDLPFEKAFTWEQGIELTVPEGIYAVNFVSKLNPLYLREGLDHPKIKELIKLDRAAHEEALKAGGLINYWYDSISDEGKASSYCLWRSIQAAKEASALPLHQEAVAYARSEETRDVYDYYNIGRYIIRRLHPAQPVVHVHLAMAA